MLPKSSSSVPTGIINSVTTTTILTILNQSYTHYSLASAKVLRSATKQGRSSMLTAAGDKRQGQGVTLTFGTVVDQNIEMIHHYLMIKNNL